MEKISILILYCRNNILLTIANSTFCRKQFLYNCVKINCAKNNCRIKTIHGTSKHKKAAL